MKTFSICLSLSDISLCILPYRSIHVAANGKNSFFFMAELFSNIYIYHIFLIHSSVNGHLGCFCILALVNNDAVSVGVRISI